MEYFSGKYVALFTAAVIILIIGSAYTPFSFGSGFFIRLFSGGSDLSACAISLSLIMLPTSPSIATGLACYLVLALYVSGDPGVNLLEIMLSMIILLVIKGQVGHVYNSLLCKFVHI